MSLYALSAQQYHSKSKSTSNFSPPLSHKKGGKAPVNHDGGEDPSDEDDSEGTSIGTAGGGGNGLAIGASTPYLAARRVYHCLSNVLSIESYII